MTTPNHDTAMRHARDVADDATRTPAARNLARAYLELREKAEAFTGRAIGRIDAMLDAMDASCWCYRCNDRPELGFANPTSQVMVICPDCGNKRCPKATYHGNACTRSNEVGQEGSRY